MSFGNMDEDHSSTSRLHSHNSDESDIPTEREPLLEHADGKKSSHSVSREPPGSTTTTTAPHDIHRGRLYVSHFLSTWNSRVFEFGAVLYLAAAFPGSLLPMSVYAFTRGVSAILFAPVVGQYIDTGDRLQVVRLSIVTQRLVVATSCVVFYLLAADVSFGPGGRTGMLAVVSFLACLEKLCSIMNSVSVEKDWVVVVTKGDEIALRTMNAQMRRIDLMCKLFGPLFIALVDGFSTKTAIVVNFAMNLVSVGVEYFAIARVYHDVPELQVPKKETKKKRSHAGQDEEEATSSSLETSESQGWFTRCRHRIEISASKTGSDFRMYFHHRAFLPSIAGSFLYLTVLGFSGQMVTYLLSTGYDATQIGVARTFSVAFEFLATWVAPWLMAKIGPVRAGLWLSVWQVAMLVAGVAVFWTFAVENPLLSAGGLVGGTILSRLGLRGFDLCIQIIVQEDVEAEHRGAFSSVEAAWQNFFELGSYASTMIFFRPQQFKWPTLISVVAVASASAAYALYVRMRRGHLVHFDVMKRLLSTSAGKQRERDRGIERITSSTSV